MREYVVYSKSACVWCDLVKELFDKYRIEYAFYDIDINQVDADFFRREGHRETPQVYLDGELIGGYQELIAHIASLVGEDGELN